MLGDHLHCCPIDHTCDVEHSRCQKGFEQFHGVVCPGGMKIEFYDLSNLIYFRWHVMFWWFGYLISKNEIIKIKF